MNWLGTEVKAETALERVLGLHPDALEAVRGFYSVLWEDQLVDPRLLELIRLRIARLYGSESELRIRYASATGIEEKIERLADWTTSPMFSDLERACLRVAEQFVMDAHGIEDSDTAPISEALGSPGLVAVMNGIALFDYLSRIRAIFDIEPESDQITIVPAPGAGSPLY